MALQSLDRWWHHGASAGGSSGLATRCLQLVALVLVLWWIFGCLGGLGFHPKSAIDGSNDTGPVFNWHPLLMVLAFPVVMGEALLAYRCPIAPGLVTRPAKKAYHVTLQLAAWVLALVGFVAAVKSHTLKLPTPIPNFYSTHSFLGLLALLLLTVQIGLGLYAYVWPKLTLPQRTALGPTHMFLGRAIFCLGLAAMATGLQEKATFLQAFSKAGVTSAAMRLPAVLQLVLAAIALGVLWHHVPSAAHPTGGIVSVSSPDIEAVPLFEQRSPPNYRTGA